MKLKIKVVPGAASSSIAGWLGDELRVRVAAPPEKGKANQAVIELLAKSLQIPVSAVQLVRGAKSQHKVLAIEGVSEAILQSRLSQLIKDA